MQSYKKNITIKNTEVPNKTTPVLYITSDTIRNDHNIDCVTYISGETLINFSSLSCQLQILPCYPWNVFWSHAKLTKQSSAAPWSYYSQIFYHHSSSSCKHGLSMVWSHIAVFRDKWLERNAGSWSSLRVRERAIGSCSTVRHTRRTRLPL